MAIKKQIVKKWRRTWMRFADVPWVGKLARKAAGLGLPPLYGKLPLSRYRDQSYISPSARLAHPLLSVARNCFIGDFVLVYQDQAGGEVQLGARVHLHENNTIQTGDAGSISIGDDTHIQPRCQLSAYCGAIDIGARVEIAPGCAFYPYNHAMVAGQPIREQPLFSEHGIRVGDDAWLGFGVVLLDGANIGAGAVVAAGSVVKGYIPANAIAAGAPARVVGHRPAA